MNDEATNPPQGMTPFAIAEAIFNEQKHVEELIEKYVSSIITQRGISTLAEKLFNDVLQRVKCWVWSLGRLRNPHDFQAVIACDRALFETTVDLTLMRFAKAAYPPEKMLAWEDSAKLEGCHRLLRYYAKRGISVPDSFKPQSEFVSRAEASILAARAKHFPPGRKGKLKHPPRWTGALLSVDVSAAQAVTPRDFSSPIDLEEFYATRYAALCWHVHGSGVTGLRFIPEGDMPTLGAEAMRECLNLAVRCAALVVSEFGIYGSEAKEAFEKCERTRRLAAISVVMHHHPTFGTFGKSPLAP